jgi:hypothetical protein
MRNIGTPKDKNAETARRLRKNNREYRTRERETPRQLHGGVVATNIDKKKGRRTPKQEESKTVRRSVRKGTFPRM